MKTLIILLVFFSASLSAQTEAWIHVGLGSPAADFPYDKSQFLNLYWKNGLNFGAGVQVAATRRLWIAPSIEYTYYRWDNFNFRGPMIPELSIRSANGHNSHLYRFLIEVRYYAQTASILQLFVTTGAGYTIEKIGAIQATVDDMNNGAFTWNVQYPGRSYFTHNLGIGLRLNVIAPLAVDLTAKYFSDYSQRFHTSINAGLLCAITE